MAATGTVRGASEHHERRAKMTTFSDSYLSVAGDAQAGPQHCGGGLLGEIQVASAQSAY
jgi:hypothetical protein